MKDGTRKDIKQIIAAFSERKFTHSGKMVPHFGIGPDPVWIRLSVNNQESTDVERTIVTGVLWLDSVKIYVVPSDIFMHFFSVIWRRFAYTTSCSI